MIGVASKRKPEAGTVTLHLRVSVVLERDKPGFHAFCPAFKGLHVDGRTKKEALSNVAAAVSVYLDSLVRENEPLPLGPNLKLLRHEMSPPISDQALLEQVELQWPFPKAFGTSSNLRPRTT